MSDLVTNARNATLADLAAILKGQQGHKLDVVRTADQLSADMGNLVVKGSEQALTDEGVTPVDGVYRPTDIADEGLGARLGIPVGYLRKCRTTLPSLYDANVNGWLHDQVRTDAGSYDDRSFLVRIFRDESVARQDAVTNGIVRAVLSDTYKPVDNLDLLLAVLAGIKAAGVPVDVYSADLSERRMRVQVACPQVASLAPALLSGYSSPFDRSDGPARANDPNGRMVQNIERWRALAANEGQGFERGKEPVVFAGFEAGNSETGGGAYYIRPKVVALICGNGLTVEGQVRKVHLGAKLENGEVRWDDEVMAKNIALITQQSRQAVQTFLSDEWLSKSVARIEKLAGVKIEHAAETLENVTAQLAFTEAEQASILDHFMLSGAQMTAGGLANAITSYAQTVPDPDRAGDINDTAVKAMELVPAAVRAVAAKR
jgi:hypothetical protein